MSQHIEERIKNGNVKMSQNEKRHVQNETTILLHFIGCFKMDCIN